MLDETLCEKMFDGTLGEMVALDSLGKQPNRGICLQMGELTNVKL
jgi:hypothetical protein